MPLAYRPPLWSQNASYTAADDRSLIQSIFKPGVIGRDHLELRPPLQGGRRVDVRTGSIVIAGTEQAEQGSYLCHLRNRQTLELSQLVSAGAGQHQNIYVYARVIEPGGAQPATWELVARAAPAGPSNQTPPGMPGGTGADRRPANAALLGVVERMNVNVNQVSEERIDDRRKLALIGIAQLETVATTANTYSPDSGQMVLVVSGASTTINLGAPERDFVVGVMNATGGGMVNIYCPSAYNIIGPGIRNRQLQLGEHGAHVVLQGAGNNWFVFGGAQDSGWRRLNLTNSNADNYSDWRPHARLIGEIVYLRGICEARGGGGSSGSLTGHTQRLGYVPAPCRPPHNVWVPARFGAFDRASGLQIRSDGSVYTDLNVPNGTTIHFDGISYPGQRR